MKHTAFSNLKLDGDILSLSVRGRRRKVTIRLSQIKKVKFPFPCVTIETRERTHRLDLRNVEPSEYGEAKAILTSAMKTNQTRANKSIQGTGAHDRARP